MESIVNYAMLVLICFAVIAVISVFTIIVVALRSKPIPVAAPATITTPVAASAAPVAIGANTGILLKIFQTIIVIGIAYTLWSIYPWGSSPPGKLLTTSVSKGTHEMIVWFSGAGLIALSSWLVWVIWTQSSVSAKREPISGVWLVWILAIFAAAVTTYSIAELVVEKKAEKESRLQIYREINLTTNESETIPMTLVTSVRVRVRTVNITKEGDKRVWVCTTVVDPSKLGFAVEIPVVSGRRTNWLEMQISKDSRQRLLDNGTAQITVKFWQKVAKTNECP